MKRKEAPPNAFLARYQDLTSGIHWRNIALAGGGTVLMVGVTGYLMLSLFGKEPESETAKVPATGNVTLNLQQRKYSDLQGKPQEAVVKPPAAPATPATPVAPAQEKKPEPARKTSTAPKKNDLLEKAIDADIAAIEVKGAVGKKGPTQARYSTDADGSDFVAGTECQVNAGTAIPGALDMAASSSLGGTIRAIVTQDVWDTATATCLAIPANSVFVGEIKKTEVRGQRRAEIVFYSLTRPKPRNDTLTLKASASDALGRGGVPGSVNTHLGSKALLVLASTAVDLGVAALSGGPWGALGSILANNGARPLDKAARDQLDLPSEIEINPLQDTESGQLTLILREHINADDFRD